MKRGILLAVAALVLCGVIYGGLRYYGGWDMDVRPPESAPRYFVSGRGVSLRAFTEPPWQPGEPLVTYIGHHTLLIELGGGRILTDPFWGDAVGYHKRLRLPKAAPEDVGPLDVVLVTSPLPGHFDSRALDALDKAATLIVPKGLARRASDLGFARVESPEPWGIVEVGDLEIVAVPTSRPEALGYIASASGSAAYVTGPTKPFDGLARVADYWQIDLLALPYLGGSAGRVFTPVEAARVVALLQPTAAIPLGYRTITRLPFFWTALDPVQFPLKHRPAAGRVVPMDVGDRLELVN